MITLLATIMRRGSTLSPVVESNTRTSAAMISQLARNPAVRNIVRGIFRGTGQAIKRRRYSRTMRGRRVVFPALDRPKRSAWAARQRARTVRAPYAVSVQKTQQNPAMMHVTRSEYSADIIQNKGFLSGIIPVIAGDDLYYPALASMASQYQIYKFDGMRCVYQPSTGADTKGQIAIAAVPTYEAVTEIKTWSDLIALRGAVTSTVWAQGLVYNVNMGDLNTQYKEFKSLTPCSTIDFAAGDQVQGYVVYGVNGCATSDTTVLGRWTVTYDVKLTKPRLDPAMSPTNIYGGTTALNLALDHGNTHWLDVDDSASTATDPTYVFSTTHRANFLVIARATQGGTAAGLPTITADSDCEVGYIDRGLAVNSLHKVVIAVVRMTGETSEKVFTLQFPTTDSAYADVRIIVRAVGRHNFLLDDGDFA